MPIADLTNIITNRPVDFLIQSGTLVGVSVATNLAFGWLDISWYQEKLPAMLQYMATEIKEGVKEGITFQIVRIYLTLKLTITSCVTSSDQECPHPGVKTLSINSQFHPILSLFSLSLC